MKPVAFSVWQPVVTLLITLLALSVAYTVRPAVAIDIGNYYDSIFLGHFHEREVDAAAPGERVDWPPDQRQLSLPGQRQGEWVVTIYAAQNQPEDALRGLAASANGERLRIARMGAGVMVAVVPPHLAASDQLVVQLEPGLREGPTPPAGLAGRVVLEPARTYRWTYAESSINLPGMGRGAWSVGMEVVTGHPDDTPTSATIQANGRTLATLPDSAAVRHVRLLVPASAMPNGDLTLEITSTPYHDPRPLGVLLSDVVVTPLAPEGPGGTIVTALPPTGTLLASIIIMLALYRCLYSMLNTPRLVLLISLAVVVPGTWALIVHRYPTTFMLPPLALLALVSLLLLPLLRFLMHRAFGQRSRVRVEQQAISLSRLSILDLHQFINIILLIFFVSFWLKAGAMLYPYFVGIDVHWHMERVRWILNGDLATLYGINSPLNESTMPLAEWGHNKPVIPYSPYYHILATSFAIFPWSLETSANMASALFDCSRVLLIALLARKSGMSIRATLLAAMLYALLPVTFLLHSWGNVPTTMGLWWTFAATTMMVIGWHRLYHPWYIVGLTLLLIASLLIYTVAGVFMGLFLILFSLCIALVDVRFWIRPPPPSPTPPDQQTTPPTPELAQAWPIPATLSAGLRPLWLATGAALILVILVYYGQYIQPIIERTIPYFARSMSSSAEAMGKSSADPVEYVVQHLRLWDYGLFIPLVLSIVWIGDYARHLWNDQSATRTDSMHVLWAAISGWLAVTIIFLPLAYKISMVDKHFFVSIPFMVLATAALIDRYGERFWPLRAVTLLWYVYLAGSALHLWVMRIMTVKQ